MPETGAQRFARLKAERSARQSAQVEAPGPTLGDRAKSAWDWANKPLVEAPSRWARSASDWLTTPEADDSWGTATAKGFAGGALEGVGDLVSGLSSPANLATTAATLGAGAAARSGAIGASRGLTQGIRVVGGLGAVHGGSQVVQGAVEGDPTKMGMGALEAIGGLAATRTPVPAKPTPKPATPVAGPTGTSFRSQLGASVPSIPEGRFGTVEAVGPLPKWAQEANAQVGPVGSAKIAPPPKLGTVDMTPPAPAPSPIAAKPFGFEKYTPENLEALAKRGNKGAIDEIARRAGLSAPAPEAPPAAKPKPKAAPKAKAAPAAEVDPGISERPFKSAKQGDVEALARKGNQFAVKELEARKVAEAAQVPVAAAVPAVEAPPPVTPKAKAAPKAKVVPDKWEMLAKELRDGGIPEEEVQVLIKRGKAQGAAPTMQAAQGSQVAQTVEAPVTPQNAHPEPIPTPVTDALKKPKIKAERVQRHQITPEATTPKLEGVPEKVPSKARPLAYAKDEVIERRAASGDADAVKEMGWRKQEEGAAFTGTLQEVLAQRTVKGKEPRLTAAQRMKDDTGAIGPGTEQLMRERAKYQESLGRKNVYDLDEWKAEMKEMGNSDYEIEGAIKAAERRGVDPTQSEDIYDLQYHLGAVAEDTAAQLKDMRAGKPPSEMAYGAKDLSKLERRFGGEREPSRWDRMKVEMEDDRIKQNWEGAIHRDPDLASRVIQDRMQRTGMTEAEARTQLYDEFAVRQKEIVRTREPRTPPSEETIGVRKFEEPPFRSYHDIPDVTEERFASIGPEDRMRTEETRRLVPSKKWYAGQPDIDRGQVEAVKARGLNDLADASDNPPSLFINENGDLQIFDGHHRSTAALEQGKALDYHVEDVQPRSAWNREIRAREPEWREAIKRQASQARESAVEGEIKSGGGRESLLGGETGAVRIRPGGQLGKGPKAAKGKTLATPKTPNMGDKVFDTINQARMASMLSGLAVPKSIAGNVGSHFTAALENRSMEPIKQLGNLGAIGRDLKTGWNASHNPAIGGALSKWNLPGRIMGAGDYAATQSLMRGGLTEAAAKEILLTSPNPVAQWDALNGKMGKLLVPFKTTPFNQLGQGLTRGAKHPGIYAGAAGLGVGAGMLSDDPEALAIAAGAAGPYGLPFTVGAMVGAGSTRAGQGLSPIPEWSIIKTLSEPQAAFTESPGLRWLKPNFGFGKKESKSQSGGRGSGSRGKSSVRGSKSR